MIYLELVKIGIIYRRFSYKTGLLSKLRLINT